MELPMDMAMDTAMDNSMHNSLTLCLLPVTHPLGSHSTAPQSHPSYLSDSPSTEMAMECEREAQIMGSYMIAIPHRISS